MNLSLNGQWRLAMDPADRGKGERWFDGGIPKDAIEVIVPGVWNTHAPDYDGVAWYFHDFDLGPEWHTVAEGDVVVIDFDAVAYLAEVWLNGTQLGSHEGGYTPFTFSARDAIRPGANRLVVRVVAASHVAASKPGAVPCFPEDNAWSCAGIWGDVTLRTLPRVHIEDVFIEPDIRRKRIAATVMTSAPCEVRLAIEGTPYSAVGEPGVIRVDFPEYELWSTEKPVLYTLRCESAVDGDVLDTAGIRFGMREFGVKENHFYLNNHPIFIKAVLHYSDYPLTLPAPPDIATARTEMQAAKTAGFNMVRFAQRPPAKMLLDIADELGMLVYEEPAIGYILDTTRTREICETQVREMILRDRNRPSVVIWGILNRTGSYDLDPNGGPQPIKADLCHFARRLDPSRLIIDDSGGAAVTRRPSSIMRPYRNELEPFDDFRISRPAPVKRDIETYYTHCGKPGSLCFLSEFGFGGLENIPEVIGQYPGDKSGTKDIRFIKESLEAAGSGFSERALDRVFGDFSGLAAESRKLQADAIRFQFDACRANAKLAGYCYAQLADTGQNMSSGILDRWRNVKAALKALADVQKPVRPLIHINQTNMTPREEIPVLVTLANNARIEGKADLSLQVVGPTNQVLWKKKRGIKIPRHGKELWTGTVGASGSPGSHKFVVRLLQNMTCLAENSVELYVFEPADPCNVEINVLDPQRAWTDRCIRFAKAGSVFALIHIVPPLANTVRAYPDNELAQVLAQVKGGAVAIIFGPPDDWNDLAERIDPALAATSRDAVGAPSGAYHYAKLHPVFDELPARGLMRQPYRNVIAPKTFLETSDEDICGTFSTENISIAGEQKSAAHARAPFWWGSDILVKRYGSGRIVFTHMRILENLGQDPVADRLFVNLLKHFSRRSVPADVILPLDQKAVEWLRHEKTDRTRKWLTIGPFPNWGGKGHDTEYPPECEVRPEGVYPGWYTAVQWTNWHSLAEDLHIVDLQAALGIGNPPHPEFDYSTAYAYAEFTCEKRQPALLRLATQNPTKVWLNGRIVHEMTAYAPPERMARETASAMLRQGRNIMLVKISKTPGPFSFSIDFESAGRESLQIKWWK